MDKYLIIITAVVLFTNPTYSQNFNTLEKIDPIAKGFSKKKLDSLGVFFRKSRVIILNDFS